MPYTSIFYALILLVFGFLAAITAYSSIGSVPFYLDDISSIVQNPVITAGVNFDLIWQHYAFRFIPYSGFAIQDALFGLEPLGYHVVSLSLHLLVALTMWLFTWRLYKASNGETSKQTRSILPATAVALLFLLHPQNSQAVAYIVQQATLWSGMFYIGSLAAYVLCRHKQGLGIRCFWLTVSVLGFGLAMLSKQNAATLPITILLIEVIFFRTWTKYLFTLGLAGLILALLSLMFLSDYNATAAFDTLDGLTRETSLISRLDYFANQGVIIWHYIGQFFYPGDLRLEYDTTVVQAWTTLQVLAWLGHGTVIALAVFLCRWQPVIAFGILFYYLAHGVESTFLPIRDLAFEHRTYLPNLGLTIAVVFFIKSVCVKFATLTGWSFVGVRLVFAGIISVIALIMAGVTHARIEIWQQPKQFYENEIALSPKSARAYSSYARVLAEEGNCPLANGYFSHAMALYENRHASALGMQPEMLIHYIRCLRELGIHAKADHWQKSLLEQVNEPVRRSMILAERGTYFLTQKDYSSAREALSEAVALNSTNYQALVNLAIVEASTGNYSRSQDLLLQALAARPGDATAEALLKRVNRLIK